MKGEGTDAGHENDAIRAANDLNRHWVPLLVIGFLVLLAYLWTDWMGSLPPPGYEALSDHDVLEELFSSRQDHLTTRSWMHRESDHGNDDQRRMLLLLAGIGFLLAYYLPVRFKRQPLAVLTCVGVLWLLGPYALALFLGWHILAYTTFHAPERHGPTALVCTALLALCMMMPADLGQWGDFASWLGWAAIVFPMFYAVYHFVYFPLLRSRAGQWLRPCVAHSSLVYIAVAVIWNSHTGERLFHPIGWLLFFWQWERLVMYYIDMRDGRVPVRLPLMLYLATFMTPATFSNFHWLSRIPLGYSYLNDRFLSRDKNKIVLSGVWLMMLAVLFFCFRPVILELFKLGMEAVGMDPVVRPGKLVDRMNRGWDPSVAAVWCVLVYSFLSFYLLWTAVAHFKVGLWRLFGYDIEPYFQKPFLATNLVELWKRYSYYYREFLVQAFYYPVFLRCFRSSPRVRIFVATFAAAGVGNLIYHLMYAALYHGATTKVIANVLTTLPYYLLLGTGIAVTQVWLVERGRKRRKPWTGGWKTGFDVLAVAGTFGFFILIRPLHHVPKDDSLGEATRLVLAALGIDL